MIRGNNTQGIQKIAIFTICLLVVVFLTNPSTVQAIPEIPSGHSTGPHIDEVIFKVIPNQDHRVLALQAGDIEMALSNFDPYHLTTFETDPDIEVAETLRNGYGHITINCRDYPLNISGLRRAFAYAYNKSNIVYEYCRNILPNPHDSLLPYVNGWCIEDELEWHYYDGNIAKGNEILDRLNFEIDSETGYRLAPNGDPFDIVIEYAVSCGPPGAVIQAVEALHALHIDAREDAADFNEYISRLDDHGEYDMVYYARNFYSNDVDWLAYEYWSEYADVEYQNPTNFRNATYDSWRDQLLHGSTYEEVYQAAAEMQKILHYNVPRFVVYENIYYQAYRNDQFTGHVEALGRPIPNHWTLSSIHKLDGTSGGSVPIAISEEPDSFNIYITNSVYSAAILSETWPSLYKYDPKFAPKPDLAKSMLTETHDDNPAVPEGHTRFTIDIIQNATWSDGEPLTANDVAFSYTYAFESAPFGNPAGTDIGDFVAAYASTPYRVVIEFATETYWHFSNFAYDIIIPEHIFNDETGIGYEGWNTWNPVFNPAEPNVNCGPFNFTDYEAGEFYKIEKNPLFHYLADPLTPIESTSSEPISSSTTTQATLPPLTWSAIVNIAVMSGSVTIIVFTIVLIIRERRRAF